MSSGQAGHRERACGGRQRSLLRRRMLGFALLCIAALPSRARAQEPAAAPSAGVESEPARAQDELARSAQPTDARSEEVRLADARLQGYLESVLERELWIARGEYTLSVREGIAYLALYGPQRV